MHALGDAAGTHGALATALAPGAVAGLASGRRVCIRQPVFRFLSAAKPRRMRYCANHPQSQRANQVEQLTLENQRLRKLLGLRATPQSAAQSAQVLYDAADPYSRKVIIDKGLADKVELGRTRAG